jgi:peptide/nickel transport system substrate-binding protein
MFTNGMDSPDPTNYLADWTTKEISERAKEWRGGNYHRYSNREFDAMHEQLLKETDIAKRNELAIKMNDILISDVVVIPLVARTQPTDGKAKNLQGIVPNSWDSVLWNIADWSKTN